MQLSGIYGKDFWGLLDIIVVSCVINICDETLVVFSFYVES